MAHITVPQVQAWLEPTKLTLGELDDELEDSVATQVLAIVAQAYATSTWTNTTNTPVLIQKIIAMEYAVWLYRRQYSEDGGTNEYADMLQAMINQLLAGIVSFIIVLTDVASPTDDLSGPAFYPTDVSDSMTPLDPTAPSAVDNDLSLGPPAFSMGQTF
jgi:hypothetical protein